MLADLEGEVAGARSRTLRRLRIAVLGAGVFLLVGLAVLKLEQAPPPANPGAGALAAVTTTASETPTPSPTASPTPTASSPNEDEASDNDLMIISRSEAGYWHLFSYDANAAAYTRLTYGPWDDIHPALSPDGGWVAFASDRGGGYDLYVLDLATGEISQLSDDLAYDGHPSWSPDGSWLAYERYVDDNLEIFMRPLDGSLEPVQISVAPGADFAPAWSPGGQQVAFISDRLGAQMAWLVDLEAEGEERFRLLSPLGVDGVRGLAWSPDGSQLAWSARGADGLWQAYAQDIDSDEIAELGAGRTLAWAADGESIAVLIEQPNAEYLSAYTPEGRLALPPVLVDGQLEGLSWGAPALDALPGGLSAAAKATPDADWLDSLAVAVQQSAARRDPVDIPGVDAPFAELNPLALPAFQALQGRAAQALGWDALSVLENALVPLNRPLEPGRQQDWLYTGRAFALPTALLERGWLVALREDFGGQIYWRIYLKAAAQDGSQGRPLTALPWDFSARYSGDDAYYQAGGRPAAALPGGYWVDLTALAQQYGWARQPARPTWQSFFQASLYNQFVLDGGLSWQQALQQIWSAAQLAEAGIEDN
jgi:TolB protein